MTRPMSEEREKLEPCPFCDRQMTLRPDGYYRHAFQRRGPLCVAEFVAVLAGDSVSAEKWNRRSTSSAERGMREALIEAERFLNYFVNGRTSFSSGGMPRSALAMVRAAISGGVEAAVPTPDPAVMRDYIIKLTRYYVEAPGWFELAEEARGYVAALSPKREDEQARGQGRSESTD